MLEARNISKTYSVVPVLHDISFRLAPGEIVGYLGANGAGKTTTVKILTGLLEPSLGQVLFDGRDISEDPLSFRRRIGFVPETPDLYPFLTGREYLLLAGRLRSLPEQPLDARVEEMLDLFSLRAARDVTLSTYSKGMMQKVMLCTALLHNPEILILDEPLSGLDATSVLIVKSLLRKLVERGKIVLYSSHLLEIVERICTRVIILHRGRIVADDSVGGLRALMQRPSLEEIFRELVLDEDTDATARSIIEAVEAPLG